MDEALDGDLAELEAEGLLRVPRVVEGRRGPDVTIDGRRVACFSSNDYLGLAGDPSIAEAMRDALAREGTGASASRLIAGTSDAHREAEERLARFVGARAALLFSSGYAANLGVLTALAEEPDAIFSDAMNHASIIDGCRLSRATTHVYPHRDADALDEMLRRHRASARRAFVVTDALFSMDGVRAPLARLRALCDAHDAWLVVDEAHALGVLGPSGRGLSAEAGAPPDVLVGTLGKAFGVAGAFVAGSSSLRRLLENRARSYVFSTAPPPALARAVLRATDLVEGADDRRARLHAHAARLRFALAERGWDARGEGVSIVPVVLGDPERTMRASSALLAEGVFAHGVRPPTVPAGTSRIRVVPTAAHDEAHIALAIGAFDRVHDRLGSGDAR